MGVLLAENLVAISLKAVNCGRKKRKVELGDTISRWSSLLLVAENHTGEIKKRNCT